MAHGRQRYGTSWETPPADVGVLSYRMPCVLRARDGAAMGPRHQVRLLWLLHLRTPLLVFASLLLDFELIPL